MDITIPVAPLGVLTLLGFFSPYAVGALNGALPFVTRPWQRKLISIVIAVLLAAVVIVFYYAITGEAISNWWLFALLAIVITQASYGLVTRNWHSLSSERRARLLSLFGGPADRATRSLKSLSAGFAQVRGISHASQALGSSV